MLWHLSGTLTSTSGPQMFHTACYASIKAKAVHINNTKKETQKKRNNKNIDESTSNINMNATKNKIVKEITLNNSES